MAQYAYATVDNETLRKLCIENDWFTCGTNEQYDKLFEANKDNWTTEDEIISMIWVCSDDCSKASIADIIGDAVENYRKHNEYKIYYRMDDDFGPVSLSETFYGGWFEMREYVDNLNKHTDCYDFDVVDVSAICDQNEDDEPFNDDQYDDVPCDDDQYDNDEQYDEVV